MRDEVGKFLALDLIDTQWNVNDIIVMIVEALPQRFNRYIVECKLYGENSVEVDKWI